MGFKWETTLEDLKEILGKKATPQLFNSLTPKDHLEIEKIALYWIHDVDRDTRTKEIIQFFENKA